MAVCHDVKGTVLNFGTFEVCKSRNFIERLAWVSYRVPKWNGKRKSVWLGCHDLPCQNRLCPEN